MLKRICLSAAVAAVLISCGDQEGSSATASVGVSVPIVVNLGNKIKCTEENDGYVVFVRDSSAYYLCEDESWVPMTFENLADTVVVHDTVYVENDTVVKTDTLWLEPSSSSAEKSSASVGKSSSSVKAKSSSSAKDESSSSEEPPVSSSSQSNTCGGKEFSYLFKFCHNDSLYTLCEGEKYDPDTQVCYDSEVVDLETCGDKTYNPKESFCSEAETVTALCNGMPYTSAQKCENNSIVTYGTCGSTAYNVAKYLCDTRDSRLYSYVTIGSQVWMAENMNRAISGSVCYEGNANYCVDRGRLYMAADAKTVCPTGWHLPSVADFNTLMNSVGGSAVAGLHLKSDEGWGSGKNGKNDYGFNGKPTGYAHYNSDPYHYYNISTTAYYWTSEGKNAFYLAASSEAAGITSSNLYPMYPVRCLKD